MNPEITSAPGGSDEQLEGWKEIAEFLGKSVRTVQRWESSEGLPVHRFADSIERVFVVRGEVERWQRDRQARSARSDGVAEQAVSGPSSTSAPGLALALATTAGIAAFALLVVFLLTIARATATQEAVYDSSPLPLRWEHVGGHVFQSQPSNQHPLALAVMPQILLSPRLSFTIVPCANATLSHAAGFAVVRNGPGLPPAPATLLEAFGLAIGRRTDAPSEPSLELVWLSGDTSKTIARVPSSFDFEPRRSYYCTLTLSGSRLTGTVSDGQVVQRLTATVKPGDVPPNTVFVRDDSFRPALAAEGAGCETAVEDLQVRDAVHRLNVGLAPPATRNTVSTSARAISVIMFGAAGVIDEPTVRLNGVPPREDRGPTGMQGIGCRHVDTRGTGTRDLVCDFDIASLHLLPSAVQLAVDAVGSNDGYRYRGHVAVEVVR